MDGLHVSLLLLVCFEFGIGLHVQIAKGARDPLSPNTVFVRRKREWIIPPVNVYEGQDNSRRNPIAKIHSDKTEYGRITYRITGKGVTEPPYGLFIINQWTGELNITGIVDREETPMFILTGYALAQDGTNVEHPIELRVKVIDINDNAPVFTEEIFYGAIEELSAANTLIMVINATDADEANNINSKLAYRIISQDPPQPPVFVLNKNTGEIRTIVANLDREKQTSYSLVVEVRDRDGKGQGLVQTSTVKIDILDVNDNIPVLEKEMYEGSVEENTAGMEVLRMKAFDNDQEGTDNWLANFTIISGNEEGYFRIETDKVTNEGVLILIKEVDYEVLQNLDINVVVSNKAAYHSSITSSSGSVGVGQGGGGATSTTKSVPVKVKVKNVLEGPVFKPKWKSLSVSENKKTTTKYQVIGKYPALDGDTGQIATNVRYAKESDPDNWFIIDEITSEIKLAKIPDRESPYVVNGTYIVKILAISDVLPGKTATGTIAIQVEDTNDNCPTIVNPIQTICDEATFINVAANDIDSFPNGAPFTFSIVDEPTGTANNWDFGQKNDTSIQLVPKNLLLPKRYDVPIIVKDNQGVSCPEKQILQLTACTCEKDGGCQEHLARAKAELGPGAIGLMVLACLLLLLLPLLLLLCYCGTGAKGFTAIPDGTVEMLRSWNNEGQPEDRAVPPHLEVMNNSNVVGSGIKQWEDGALGSNSFEGSTKGGMYEHSIYEKKWEERHLLGTAAGSTLRTGGGIVGAGAAAGGGIVGGGAVIGGMKAGGAGGAEGNYRAGSFGAGLIETTSNFGAGGALQNDFIKDYFNDKSLFYAAEDDRHPAKDCLLVYSQEGMNSPTGSIGCCSLIDDELDESYLDDLGDKFKTLAEICLGQQMYTKMEESQSSSKRQGRSVGFSDSSVSNVQHENSYSSYESNRLAEPTIVPEIETRQEMVSEESFSSRSNVHSVPQVHDNVLVTEKSYMTVPAMQPVTIIREPRLQQNVLMTERVLTPGSNLHGMLDMHDGQNILVTERYINGDSGLMGLHDMPDSQYIVVRERERVLAPAAGMQTAKGIHELSDGQNLLVTERIFQPVSPGLQRNGIIPSEASSVQNIITEKHVVSGTGIQGHRLTSDPLLNNTGFTLQEAPSPNHGLGQSSSRISKYSTVQYTRS